MTVFNTAQIDVNRIYPLSLLEGDFELSRTTVGRLVDRGELATLGTGVYVHSDFVPNPGQDDLAVISLRCPAVVFNLRTAAELHGLNEDAITGYHFAIPRTQKPPQIGRGYGSELFAMRQAREIDLTVGIEERVIRGVTVRLTNPERTVCDMWRYSYNNPALRGNPQTRISDESLNYCVTTYLNQNDGAESGLTDMISDLELPRAMRSSFIQFIRVFAAGYNSNRVF